MKLCLTCGERFHGIAWKCPSCGYTPGMDSGHWIFAPEVAGQKDGFDTSYFRELARIEEQNWWFGSRKRLILWAFGRHFAGARNFLEVGCGTGFILSGILKAFPGVSLAGSDLFMKSLAFAGRRLPQVPLFQMDARRMPFEEEFDVVGAFDVLEHIEDDEAVFFQLFKAVKKGGGIILTVPQHPFLWSDQDCYTYHKRRYARKDLIKKVQKSGFQRIQSISFVSLLLPFMILARLSRHKKGGKFNVFEEFRIGGYLNSALSKVMDFEFFLVRHGLSLSMGGSLLLTANKI